MLVRFDLRELRADLGDEVNAFLVDVASEIVNEMKEEAPVDGGRLRGSFQIFRESENVVWLGTRLDYAGYVWKGTEPHTAPFEPIRVWARRKLKDESAAGPVWQKIRQEGTDANPFVERAVDQALDRVA